MPAAGDRAGDWLTSLVAVLLLTRYFLPAESAALGEALWIVQIWLVSAVIWFWLAARRGGPRRPFDAFDGAVGLLVGGHVLSAVAILVTDGDRRAGLNMLWEWIGIAVATLMIRDVLQHVAGRSRLLSVVVLAAITLAGLGLWQHHVWYPSLSEKLVEFDRLRSTPPADPQSAVERQQRLQELGDQLGPLVSGGDSTSDQMLRARVAASTEPIARFALANTFAGLLLVGLLLGLGLLTAERSGGDVDWRWWTGALLILATAYCFWLTKSRTALVGLLAGMLAWLLLSRRSGQWTRSLRWGAVVAGALLIVLPVIGALAGGLDREVITEAPKSLQYRLEYWSTTGAVIRESPLLGVGPGNFRQAYLAHKLPGSSEEVLDPHNLLLDVWANGGLLGLAGLLWLVALLVRASWRLAAAERSIANDLTDDTVEAVGARSVLSDAVIGVAALLLAAFVNLMNGSGFLVELWWLVAGWCVVCLLWPVRTRRERLASAAAATALVIHLMGAGGIAMPAILLTLILVGASLVSAPTQAAAQPAQAEWSALPPPLPWRSMLGAGLCLCLAVACAFSATLPVSASRTQVAIAQSILAQGGRPDEAIRALQSAIEADPLSPEAWQQLAMAHASAWQRQASSDQTAFESAVQAQQEAIRLDPHAAGRWQLLGDLWWLRYEITVDTESAQQALGAYRQAVERYPNLATLQGKLAEAAEINGETNLARRAAVRALELDAANRQAGHVDKYLPEAMRERTAAIAGTDAFEL